MSDESDPVKENSLVIRPSTGLVSLPEDGSPALSEIISRSLAHIQTSKSLGMLHRIGEHELYGPDYRLVCAFAEEKGMTSEEVLDAILERSVLVDDDGPYWGSSDAEIDNGHFVSLRFPFESIPKTFFPIGGNILSLPNLKELRLSGNQLTNLDLSGSQQLMDLDCGNNLLTRLDLSELPNLKKLYLSDNKLTNLDLSGTPLLTDLYCKNNLLTHLDLSELPNLKELDCSGNPFIDLDIRREEDLCRSDIPF